MSDRQIYLGYALSPFGFGAGSWRNGTSEELQFDAALRQVRDARGAGIHFITLFDRFGDRPADTFLPGNLTFEPTTLAAALSSRARGIGFLVGASTAQHEPYNLARRFASLETLNGGRTGWLILDGGEDRDRDVEYLEVVRGLWNSWDDGAFLYDKAAGRFFDPSKMRVLDHRGVSLSVRGPLNVNRSPQGEPVTGIVFGRSDPALVPHADVVILQTRSLDETRLAKQEVVGLLRSRGRDLASVRLLLNLVLADVESGNGEIPKAEGDVGIGGTIVQESGAALAQAMDAIARDAGIDGFNVVPTTLAAANRFFDDTALRLNHSGSTNAGNRGATLRAALGLTATGISTIRAER